MAYSIEYKRSVEKDLRSLAPAVLRKIIPLIQTLAQDPRPHGVKKLQGADGLYRLRSGDYRIIYSIKDETITVTIIKIGHRKEIYR